jgi:cell division septal protein FtsQ
MLDALRCADTFRRVHCGSCRHGARRLLASPHLPGAALVGTPRRSGRQAGFAVKKVEIKGLNRMQRLPVYNVAYDQNSMAMPLVDLEGTRQRLLRFGWVKDARVYRRLPDTLVVDIVERQPAAIWQHKQQLSLIDASGVVLEPVKVDAMPDLPLVIGPAANRQAARLGDLLAAAPELKPIIEGASWVGQRRWDLRFQSGEVLALPEGSEAARKALVKFARMDKSVQLLGRGMVRFDMRIPGQVHRSGLQGAGQRRSRCGGAARARARCCRRWGENDLSRRLPAPPPRKLVTALDIGSAKISALIAEPGENGELKILGTGQRESRGVKRGFVADMERTEATIREAVEQAERIAGTHIEERVRRILGRRPRSDVASDEVEIGGRSIEEQDVDQLLGVGRQSIDPGGKMILHAMPALYTLDGLQGVKQRWASMPTSSPWTSTSSPPSRRRSRISICASAPPISASRRSSPRRWLPANPASARRSASSASPGGAWRRRHQRLVFAGGMLVGVASLPIGGVDITDDIASAFGMRRMEAERMKCFYGSAMTSPRDNHDMIEIAPIAGGEEGTESLAHHPRAAHRRHPPAARASDGRDCADAEGPRLLRTLWASGGADGRRIGAEGHGRLCAGRARPRRPHRPARRCRACRRRIAAQPFATLAGPRPVRRVQRTRPSPARRAFAAAQKSEGGNVLSRLIAAFRTQY